MTDNIVRLAVSNDGPKPTGEDAYKLVVSFLREWADAIERGDDKRPESAVLIMYEKLPDGCFAVSSRRCNIDFLSTVGVLHLALAHLASADE